MTFSVKDRRVTVIGGGRSGLAAAALLVSRGARVTLADTAAAIEGAQQLTDLGVTLALGPHSPALLAESDLIVLSPGVPPGQEAIVEVGYLRLRIQRLLHKIADWRLTPIGKCHTARAFKAFA